MARVVLDELVRRSFDAFQILFHHNRFHNHNAHHLGSLFLLGADGKQLKDAYALMSNIVDPYEPSPHSITRDNWRESLGDRRFCQAYRDFFVQELLNDETHWKEKMLTILFEDKAHPLINGFIFGVLHPLIHLGYAFALDNPIVGVEALTLFAVTYDRLHRMIDELPSPQSASLSPWQIFDNVRLDEQLKMDEKPLSESLPFVFAKFTDGVLFHYNQWQMEEDEEKVLEDLFDFSVYVYGATHRSDEVTFDFYLLHLLTGVHAMRLLHPHVHDRRAMRHLLREFFYFALILYVARGRPAIRRELIDRSSIDNADWSEVIERTLNSDLAKIMHLVKVIYSLKEAEMVYGKKNGLYLKTAIKSVNNVKFDQPWKGGNDNPHYLASLKQH